MAKIKSASGNEISLFPFFNILVCLLGILIFIMTASVVISIGLKRSVVVKMEGFGSNSSTKKPHFVEWYGDRVIIHPSKDTLRFNSPITLIKDIPKSIKNTSLEKLIEKVKTNREKEYIIFLIRPSGFNNFWYIKRYIIDNKIDIGWEPVEQNFQLRIKQN